MKVQDTPETEDAILQISEQAEEEPETETEDEDEVLDTEEDSDLDDEVTPLPTLLPKPLVQAARQIVKGRWGYHPKKHHWRGHHGGHHGGHHQKILNHHGGWKHHLEGKVVNKPGHGKFVFTNGKWVKHVEPAEEQTIDAATTEEPLVLAAQVEEAVVLAPVEAVDDAAAAKTEAAVVTPLPQPKQKPAFTFKR